MSTTAVRTGLAVPVILLLAACTANTARLADGHVRATDLRECAAVRAGEAERMSDGSISMEDHRRCETGATWSTRRETVPAPDFRRPVSDP